MAFRSLRRKISIGLAVATLFFSVSMVAFAQTVIRAKLVEQLLQKSVVIAKRVAFDAVNPVITERYFEVAMMFKDLQAADPDVVYAFLLDEAGRERAHTFSGGLPPGLRGAHTVDASLPFSVKELTTDRGAVLDVGVPLLKGQVGVLHLGVSLTSIRREVNGIVLLIVLFGAVSLLVGLVASIGFSRVLTRPLLNLAKAAESFGRGEAREPVVVSSDDEVGHLGRVFNAMMESREQARQEQGRLIAELQRTLGEVKTLRGFLPICASCKKIRRDEGSWQQIESYIREHSEAQFSHGLCPECVDKLYPGFSGAPGNTAAGTP